MANENQAPPRNTSRIAVFLILLTSFLTLIAASAISVGYSVHRYWANVLRAEITRDLTQKTQMFARRVNTDRQHKIEDITSQEGQSAGARATVIDGNAAVVADSEVAAASLEDEGRRPEFASALRGETGTETRKRNGIPVLYVAVPISGGAVRLAYPLADIEIATAQARHILLIGCAIATAAAIAISALATRTLKRS